MDPRVDRAAAQVEPGISLSLEEILVHRMKTAREFLERKGWSLTSGLEAVLPHCGRQWVKRLPSGRELLNADMEWEEVLAAGIFNGADRAMLARKMGEVDLALGSAWMGGFWHGISSASLTRSRAARDSKKKGVEVSDELLLTVAEEGRKRRPKELLAEVVADELKSMGKKRGISPKRIAHRLATLLKPR